MQDYLASITPMNTDVTDHEIKEYEAHINHIDPAEVEQANDPFLIESLRERAAQGDSSASMQLDLLEIKKEGFAQIGLTPEAPPIEPMETPIIPMDNAMLEPITPPPIVETPTFEPAPDLAMSWCSSTPETLAFSESFVLPEEMFNPMEAWDAASPEMSKSSINQHNVL